MVPYKTTQTTVLINKWASAQETCLWGYANNKGADQPVHPHSLISAFVIGLIGKYNI